MAWRRFNRRSATKWFGTIGDRGLKPTATVERSLRDEDKHSLALRATCWRVVLFRGRVLLAVDVELHVRPRFAEGSDSRRGVLSASFRVIDRVL